MKSSTKRVITMLRDTGVVIDLSHTLFDGYCAALDFTNATFEWPGAVTIKHDYLSEEAVYGLALGILSCSWV